MRITRGGSLILHDFIFDELKQSFSSSIAGLTSFEWISATLCCKAARGRSSSTDLVRSAIFARKRPSSLLWSSRKRRILSTDVSGLMAALLRHGPGLRHHGRRDVRRMARLCGQRTHSPDHGVYQAHLSLRYSPPVDIWRLTARRFSAVRALDWERFPRPQRTRKLRNGYRLSTNRAVP